MTKRKLALYGLLFVIAALVAIYTGFSANTTMFWTLIGLFVATQLAWLAYLYRRQRIEQIDRNLERLFPDD